MSFKAPLYQKGTNHWFNHTLRDNIFLVSMVPWRIGTEKKPNKFTVFSSLALGLEDGMKTGQGKVLLPVSGQALATCLLSKSCHRSLSRALSGKHNVSHLTSRPNFQGAS